MDQAIRDLNLILSTHMLFFQAWREKRRSEGVQQPLIMDHEDRLDRIWNCLYCLELRLQGRDEEAREWKAWALDPRDWREINRALYDKL
jgi:hypothetical protein